MKRNQLVFVILALASAHAVTACAGAPDSGIASKSSSTPALATHPAPDAPVQSPVPAQSALPLMVVSKSPNCGCCQLWVEHMEHAGFTVQVVNTNNVNAIKERVGIPYGKGSCHTAEVDGYFVEGHIPADDIKRLLTERPEGKGLVVPGMPAGSPGMELPDGRVQPYVVELVAYDGTTSAFAHHAD
ncbi:hypothetical protein N792_07940 [Lysobacter concretionis Ko07 = DSM 16239]|uniref:Copper amine oxidase n=2 Tax=Novilysobacter TaxID=3382699 RepID=A0A0A0EQZ6_9GAMM|nr:MULTISPECIES: DUF411 domain-containing protein [Lysobacter]KGM51612.1 hypothetical protein N792_07940 [Lysobacter concretionis Ko07 = DSM 16239]QOD90009.1 DUF411 domain-containing protein [Lysobacter sp. CW239]QOW18443.1 DUF411 domain-containing protein [Lysobacter ciconiae]